MLFRLPDKSFGYLDIGPNDCKPLAENLWNAPRAVTPRECFSANLIEYATPKKICSILTIRYDFNKNLNLNFSICHMGMVLFIYYYN
jgi:hypothetical protein